MAAKELHILLCAGENVAERTRCGGLDAAHPRSEASVPECRMLEQAVLEIVTQHEPRLARPRTRDLRAPGAITDDQISLGERATQTSRDESAPEQLVLPYSRVVQSPRGSLYESESEAEIRLLRQVLLDVYYLAVPTSARQQVIILAAAGQTVNQHFVAEACQGAGNTPGAQMGAGLIREDPKAGDDQDPLGIASAYLVSHSDPRIWGAAVGRNASKPVEHRPEDPRMRRR